MGAIKLPDPSPALQSEEPAKSSPAASSAARSPASELARSASLANGRASPSASPLRSESRSVSPVAPRSLSRTPLSPPRRQAPPAWTRSHAGNVASTLLHPNLRLLDAQLHACSTAQGLSLAPCVLAECECLTG